MQITELLEKQLVRVSSQSQITSMSFKSIISCSASRKYGLQYLKTVTCLPSAIFSLDKTALTLSLQILFSGNSCFPTFNYLQRVHTYIYVCVCVCVCVYSLNCSAQWSITRAGRTASVPMQLICNFSPKSQCSLCNFFLLQNPNYC